MRQIINAAARDDRGPALEIVNLRTGAEPVAVIAPSGLTIVPVTLTAMPPQPQITGGSRGIVNSSDGTPNLRPGSFITINGANPASAAAADAVPLPLIRTARSQISAQVPEDMRPGGNVVQVRSLMNAASSDPIVVTVQR